jgi:hypothetical protein
VAQKVLSKIHRNVLNPLNETMKFIKTLFNYFNNFNLLPHAVLLKKTTDSKQQPAQPDAPSPYVNGKTIQWRYASGQ